jgi:hypothetical protein
MTIVLTKVWILGGLKWEKKTCGLKIDRVREKGTKLSTTIVMTMVGVS